MFAEKVLKPLEEARASDPDNARIVAQLGLGYVQFWEYSKRKDLLKELLPKMGNE